MTDKLTASIKIRTTPDEKIQWQEKAIYSGVSLSNLVRQAMSRTNTWTTPDRSLIQAQTRQLTRIGNNLNQIAKWANTYKSTAEAIEIIQALRAIALTLQHLPTPPSSFPSAPPPEAKQDVT
ncbi:plasmid mobilization relaxosome protein MobC [Merismopedia glauca CCAP 1448/3]|uniref:Plasmid mobilization relaxosome protein MobC n=2 Tax=Merismopedia TaxID=53402 RepID=A0A2T1BY07_9CYAN|nr:plasmid mobilization relaxosome protein MobC [Merismopedia glauca CCAP 1448/3]